MTTYEMINGNMECPFYGKILIEHELTDRVTCRDINCRFNKDILTELLNREENN